MLKKIKDILDEYHIHVLALGTVSVGVITAVLRLIDYMLFRIQADKYSIKGIFYEPNSHIELDVIRGIIILLFTYFTYTIIKDIKKKNKSEDELKFLMFKCIILVIINGLISFSFYSFGLKALVMALITTILELLMVYIMYSIDNPKKKIKKEKSTDARVANEEVAIVVQHNNQTEDKKIVRVFERVSIITTIFLALIYFAYLNFINNNKEYRILESTSDCRVVVYETKNYYIVSDCAIYNDYLTINSYTSEKVNTSNIKTIKYTFSEVNIERNKKK